MSSSAGKNVKNYLYDNPQLKDLKPMIAELDNDLDSSDNEIWLLQCPKSFEPQQLIQKDLENQSKIEFNVDRFYEKKTLAIITPDKAADLVCDSLKLVSRSFEINLYLTFFLLTFHEPIFRKIKPVGKIVLSERLSNFSIESEPLNRSQTAFDSSSNSCSDSCSEVSKPEPANRKKLSKNFKDQKFTIETTVTVEKCGDRKRNKISGQDKYLPLETTSSKKQKNNKKA